MNMMSPLRRSNKAPVKPSPDPDDNDILRDRVTEGMDSNAQYCQSTDGSISLDRNCEIDMECDHEDCNDKVGRSSLDSEQHVHDLQEGDHIVRWMMLGYCYPVQVHGIVLSAGPELITIVDCGMTPLKNDKVGSFDADGKSHSPWKKIRRRLNILTLVDVKEIKKWKKVQYGEQCELKVVSTASNQTWIEDKSITDGMYPELEHEKEHLTDPDNTIHTDVDNHDQTVNDAKSSKPPVSKLSLFWPFGSSKSTSSNLLEQSGHSQPEEPTNSTTSQRASDKDLPEENSVFKFPKSDPPALVLARLRFLIEYADEDSTCNNETQQHLLPPHHIFYANSECIAVWIKTGHWSTLQAALFLHSSTIGNVKQTATLAMYLSAQTVTMPAAGIWGFFGGTTTISLFSAQPWIVPALVGGGIVYAGLPTVVLWKAKSRWIETEKKLNLAFWENVDPVLIVTLIQIWSGLEMC